MEVEDGKTSLKYLSPRISAGASPTHAAFRLFFESLRLVKPFPLAT